jgi:hypothetical protein
MFFSRRMTALQPVADSTHCRCRCRCHGDAEQHAKPVNGIVGPGVERTDAVGAATACSHCLKYHAIALSGHPVSLDLRARHAIRQHQEQKGTDAGLAPRRTRTSEVVPDPLAGITVTAQMQPGGLASRSRACRPVCSRP